MSALAELGRVVSATVESLKSQPLALALIAINVLFLVGFVLHEIAQAVERKDALLAEIASHCVK